MKGKAKQMETVRPPGRLRDNPTVFIVDDDERIRQSLDYLLSGVGFSVVKSASAADALEHCDPAALGCYLLDIHLPDMDGLQLHERLVAQGCRQPFIVLSRHGDVSVAVEALQRGAMDFLEKPFDGQRLLQRIEQAILSDARRRDVQDAIDSLTDRERQLLPMIAEGKLSKEIAKSLDISPRTVEVHRRNVMLKMGVDSVAQMVRMLTEHLSETRFEWDGRSAG